MSFVTLEAAKAMDNTFFNERLMSQTGVGDERFW
jgi:hypothetical protein